MEKDDLFEKVIRGEITEQEFFDIRVKEDKEREREYQKTKRRATIGLLLTIALILSIGVGALRLSFQWEKKWASTWTVVAEGTYSKVVYGGNETTHRTHGVTHRNLAKITAIYFDDGRTCAMTGFYDIQFPIGTPIRVSKNEMNDYKIEKIESPD